MKKINDIDSVIHACSVALCFDTISRWKAIFPNFCASSSIQVLRNPQHRSDGDIMISIELILPYLIVWLDGLRCFALFHRYQVYVVRYMRYAAWYGVLR